MGLHAADDTPLDRADHDERDLPIELWVLLGEFPAAGLALRSTVEAWRAGRLSGHVDDQG